VIQGFIFGPAIREQCKFTVRPNLPFWDLFNVVKNYYFLVKLHKQSVNCATFIPTTNWGGQNGNLKLKFYIFTTLSTHNVHCGCTKHISLDLFISGKIVIITSTTYLYVGWKQYALQNTQYKLNRIKILKYKLPTYDVLLK